MLIKKINIKKLFANTRRNFATKIEDIFTKQKLYDFNEKGYAVLPNVFSKERIDELKSEIQKIIEGADVNEIKSVFDPAHINKSNYFSESGDKVSK